MEIRTIKLKLLRDNESGFSFVSPITQYIILLFAIRICSEPPLKQKEVIKSLFYSGLKPHK